MRIVGILGHDFEELKRRLEATAGTDASPRQPEAEMLLGLFRYLESRGPEPRIAAVRMLQEVWFHPETTRGGLIRLSIDHNDWDRERRLHYRLSFKPHDSPLSADLRTSEPAEVERFILDCIARSS